MSDSIVPKFDYKLYVQSTITGSTIGTHLLSTEFDNLKGGITYRYVVSDYRKGGSYTYVNPTTNNLCYIETIEPLVYTTFVSDSNNSTNNNGEFNVNVSTAARFYNYYLTQYDSFDVALSTIKSENNPLPNYTFKNLLGGVNYSIRVFIQDNYPSPNDNHNVSSAKIFIGSTLPIKFNIGLTNPSNGTLNNNGIITVNFDFVVSPYNIYLYNNSTNELIASKTNLKTNINNPSDVFNGLIGGITYKIFVSDKRLKTSETTVEMYTSLPISVSTRIDRPTNVQNNNGLLNLTITNGTPNYTIELLDYNTQALISTQENVSSNLPTIYNIVGNKSYTIRITDRRGSVYTYTSPEIKVQNTVLQFGYNVIQPQTEANMDGEIIVNYIVGGTSQVNTGLYQYELLFNGSIYNQISGTTSTYLELHNIQGGRTYTLMIKDFSVPFESSGVSIYVPNWTPNLLNVDIIVTNTNNVDDNNGIIDAIVTNATGSFVYDLYKNGESEPFISYTSTSTEQIFNNLNGDTTYMLIITGGGSSYTNTNIQILSTVIGIEYDVIQSLEFLGDITQYENLILGFDYNVLNSSETPDNFIIVNTIDNAVSPYSFIYNSITNKTELTQINTDKTTIAPYIDYKYEVKNTNLNYKKTNVIGNFLYDLSSHNTNFLTLGNSANTLNSILTFESVNLPLVIQDGASSVLKLLYVYTQTNPTFGRLTHNGITGLWLHAIIRINSDTNNNGTPFNSESRFIFTSLSGTVSVNGQDYADSKFYFNNGDSVYTFNPITNDVILNFYCQFEFSDIVSNAEILTLMIDSGTYELEISFDGTFEQSETYYTNLGSPINFYSGSTAIQEFTGNVNISLPMVNYKVLFNYGKDGFIDIFTLNTPESKNMSDGVLNIRFLGGKYPYVYTVNYEGQLISQGTISINTVTINGLFGDRTYDIQVTDANNKTNTESTYLAKYVNTNLNVTISTTTPTIFANSDGVLSGTISSGNPPYRVELYNGVNSLAWVNTPLDFSFGGLTGGINYTIKITDSGNEMYYNVIFLDKYHVENLTATVVSTPPTNNSNNDATMVITLTPSNPPYHYHIYTDTAEIYQLSSTYDTSVTLNSLIGNKYYNVDIQDSYYKNYSTRLYISNYIDTYLIGDYVEIQPNVSTNDNGGVTINIINGAANYTYKLLIGTEVISSITTSSKTNTFSNMTGGILYTITVFDSNLISYTLNVTLPSVKMVNYTVTQEILFDIIDPVYYSDLIGSSIKVSSSNHTPTIFTTLHQTNENKAHTLDIYNTNYLKLTQVDSFSDVLIGGVSYTYLVDSLRFYYNNSGYKQELSLPEIPTQVNINTSGSLEILNSSMNDQIIISTDTRRIINLSFSGTILSITQNSLYFIKFEIIIDINSGNSMLNIDTRIVFDGLDIELFSQPGGTTESFHVVYNSTFPNTSYTMNGSGELVYTFDVPLFINSFFVGTPTLANIGTVTFSTPNYMFQVILNDGSTHPINVINTDVYYFKTYPTVPQLMGFTEFSGDNGTTPVSTMLDNYKITFDYTTT